jgi:hypothetical protein
MMRVSVSKKQNVTLGFQQLSALALCPEFPSGTSWLSASLPVRHLLVFRCVVQANMYGGLGMARRSPYNSS